MTLIMIQKVITALRVTLFSNFIKGLISNKYYMRAHINYQLITGIVCKCMGVDIHLFEAGDWVKITEAK